MSVTAVLSTLSDHSDWQREMYLDLHRHPELSTQEVRTAGIIEHKLRELGYAVQRIGGTGVVGVLANGEGRTVLSRADTDGLPVIEATGLEYASAATATDDQGNTTGVMHACGHDMHVATLLGAAALMADHRDAWSGTHVALFQPAEETASGAQMMLDDGLAEKIPRPDVALGQHVMSYEAGLVRTTAGPILSAGDSIRITLHGSGAHGSMPDRSVDPVVLAAAVVLRLQTIISREVSPKEFAVITVGAIKAGAKSNIIPDRATLLVNLRTYDPEVRARVIEAVERIVRGECAAAGSPREPEFQYYDQFPLTSNDEAANNIITAAFADHFGPEVVQRQEPATASEDFSRIPDAFGVPYTYWTLGSVAPDRYQRSAQAGTVSTDIPANHSPFFYPEIEPTLSIGTQTHVIAALAHLADSALTSTRPA